MSADRWFGRTCGHPPVQLLGGERRKVPGASRERYFDNPVHSPINGHGYLHLAGMHRLSGLMSPLGHKTAPGRQQLASADRV